jgi:hypothetical protein
MRKEFTHLLLTRFNTAADFAPSRLGLQRKWLTNRLALFEQYCFPSVDSQKDVDFRWLVFFDAESPEWLRETIPNYEPRLTPIFIEGEATDEKIAETVANSGLVTTPYLITTRLDNDDSLAEDHLARVQGAFHNQEREFVQFPLGLQMYRGHLYHVYWPSNPFLSLIEKVGEGNSLTTVLCVPHNRVRSAGKVRSLWCAAQWMQVLHGSNLLNNLRGWPRLRSKRHPHFQIYWPDEIGHDSMAARVGISAASYKARADKFAARLGARVSF